MFRLSRKRLKTNGVIELPRSCHGMAHSGHIRVCRLGIVLFSSSTWGRADQHTSQDSNRVWGVLFCA